MRAKGRTNLVERRSTKEDDSETDDETRGLPSCSREDAEESVLEGELERSGEFVELLADGHFLFGGKEDKKEDQRQIDDETMGDEKRRRTNLLDD